MPTPFENVKREVTLIGASYALSELSMERAFIGHEKFKEWTEQEIGNGIITEILKNPNFALSEEEFLGNTVFRGKVGVIFDLDKFIETIRKALSDEYTHGYKRALEEMVVAEEEERAAQAQVEIDAILSEANELRVTDER